MKVFVLNALFFCLAGGVGAAEEPLSSPRIALFLQILDDLKDQAASLPEQLPEETQKEMADPFGDPFALRLSLLADKPAVADYLAKKGMKKSGFTALASKIWRTWLAVRLSEDKEYLQGLSQLENAFRSPQTTSEEKVILRQRWEDLRLLGQFKPQDRDALVPHMKALNELFMGNL